MAKQVTIDIESLPEGMEVEVPGLGVFLNGSTTTIDEDRLAQYEAAGFKGFEEGDTMEFVYDNAPEGPTLPAETSLSVDEAGRTSEEAMQAQLEEQKDRENDPLKTANIGLSSEVPTEEDN